MSRPLNAQRDPEWSDDSRYAIERKLGEGGAGAVFLARDRETGEQVALKKLFRMDAKSVLRLKREFRGLIDVNHPHIIKLYDMGRTSDGWFLTMEYVEGTDLSTYLHASESAARRTGVGSFQQQLLSSFGQLARGVHALHKAGMLHRDLKPSNVLVVDHRVVVLDFGLAREISVDAATLTEDGSVSGTPAYMAPEQLTCQPLDEACDWYAFGVMLYEALSGLLPIDGTLVEILRGKIDSDPAPIHELAPWTQPEVLDLCMALLQRDPKRRPGAEQVMAVLHRSAEQPADPSAYVQTENTYPTETEVQPVASGLYGRQAELAALQAALTEAEQGRAVVVHVRGASGAGKSALVEHFLDGVEVQSAVSRSDTLVLRTRCYELEAMPFKALDGVIDALVRHLSRLDDLTVAHVLPTDVAALTQVFPALERLAVVQRLLGKRRLAPDAILDRQRAEAALRAWLDAVAAHTPIVMWIDDLQWGDLDSARILQNWLQHPAQAQILFVFSYRSEEITTNSCLARLLQSERSADSLRNAAAEHTIDLEPLADAEIRELCEQRLGGLARTHATVVDRIVREAQGSPFLAAQLTVVAEAKFACGDSDWGGLTIDALVAQTSALLPADAKTLLKVLAVVGRPIAPKLALKAAGIQRNGRSLVHALRGLNLVRTREVGGERMLAVHHDRVRESVSASLTEHERRLIHGNLFHTLRFGEQVDPDFLHALALSAGLRAEALSYGKAAAERANASLAFERATEVYERCINLADAGEVAELWTKLALARGRCGRGVQAADAYLEAAKRVPARAAVALTQMAAAHLLRSGRFEQGEALANKVVADMQIKIPASDRGVRAALVWERARLKLRGLECELRAPELVPAELLAQHDTFENLGSVFFNIDPLRASLFYLRGLHSALEAREPSRLVLALCRVATGAAISASSGAARESEALLVRAENLANASGTHAQAAITSTRVFASYFFGRHLQVVIFSDAALHALRTDPHADTRGNYYRRHMVSAMRVRSLYMLGRYKELVSELTALLAEARATDNRALILNVAAAQVQMEEVLDISASARSRLEQQARELPKNRFGTIHVVHMMAVASAACFLEDYALAADCLDMHWDRFMGSSIGRGGWWRLALHATRARLLLNRHVTAGADRTLLTTVREDWAWLAKQGASHAAKRVAARLAHIGGDVPRAIQCLRDAILELEAQSMFGEAARDRYALGAMLGGAQGRPLREASLCQLRLLGVVNPRRMLRAHYPEFIEAE